MRDGERGDAPAAAHPIPLALHDHRAGFHLLVIEDDPGDLMLFRSTLGRSGLAVGALVEAGTLAEGLVLLDGDPPDVVIVDLGLPDADRLDAVAALVDAAPTVPLLVLTGADDVDFRTEAVAAGAQDYLVKGRLDPHQLAWAIRFAVERAQHARAEVRRAIERVTLSRLERAHQEVGGLDDHLGRIIEAVREVLPLAAVDLVVTRHDLPRVRRGDGELADPTARLHIGDDELSLDLAVSADLGDDEAGVRSFLQRLTDTAYDGLRSLLTAGELSLRTRQLAALHTIARAVHEAHDGATLVARVAEALAAALPHPEDLRVVVHADGHQASAGRAAGDVITRVRAGIRVRETSAGTVTAGYTVDHDVREADLALLQHTADLLSAWLGRREAEQGQARERARLDLLMETAPVGVVLTDGDGRISYLNHDAREILGATADQEIVLETPEGGPVPAHEHPLSLVRSRREPVRGLVHAIPGTGTSRRMVSVNASPLFDHRGGFDGMVATITDITEQRRASRELAESRARLEALLEQLPAVAWTVDADLRLTRLTGSILADLEVVPSVGDELTAIADDADGEAVIAAHRRALAGEHQQVTFTWANRHCRAALEPLRDGQGAIVGIVGVGIDVTDRLAAERAVRANEARFRSLAEHAVEGIFRLQVEPELVYQYVNPAFARIAGHSREAIAGYSGDTLRAMHPVDPASVQEPGVLELPLVTGDGRSRWVRVRVSTRSEEDGAVVLQGTMLDITEEREADQALRRALDREQEASESLRRLDGLKDGFLRAVSHELRTPLTAVFGFASTLRQHHAALDAIHFDELLERLLTNADRLRRLLEDLLDLNRLTSADVHAELERVELSSLVRRAARECAVEGRTLRVDGAPLDAQVDPVQVERIVHNLVLNAVRHTPEGTTIWVTTAAGDGHVSIAVEDDGPGIPDELKATVLAPFVQGPHSAASPKPGTGIGLSLVQQFVRMHQGTVTVEDRPGGRGTRIEVRLPDQPES